MSCLFGLRLNPHKNKACPVGKASNNTSDLEAVMNTVLDGLIVIDSKGHIEMFNNAAERIFGYHPLEVIGKNVKMLMPDPYHSEHDKYLSNYLQTNEAKIIGTGREVMARRKSGDNFPVELGVNEMNVNNQRKFVGTIRDISERKRWETEIGNYITALKRSNQELDDFAYIASHDLKEPLRGLSNNALFLREDYEDILDEDGVKRLDRINYLCKRLENLVDDLLHFSRLGRLDLAIQKTDLNKIVDDIKELNAQALSEANVYIIVPRPLPIIVCDRPRITEVLRNLITNAYRYNDKEKKEIEIGYSFEKGAYIFYVKDNGIGIKAEFHDVIFRIFKRLKNESNASGTGVGLTFVKKIIERHGGKIWLESTPGKGTTFFFNIKEPEANTND